MAEYQPETPISTHRLFPAVVAIWFAALLGLGCAVLPDSLYQRLLPGAALPMGTGLRIAICTIAALAGALAGQALARRIAAAQGAVRSADVERRLRKPRKQPAPDTRRPISALQELGVESFDSPTVEPLASEPDAQEQPETEAAPESSSRLAALMNAAFPGETETPTAPDAGDPDWREPEEDVADTQESAPDDTAEAEANRGRAAMPEDRSVPLEQLGMVELVERLGASLHKRARRADAPAPAFIAQLKAALAGEAMPQPDRSDRTSAGNTMQADDSPEMPPFTVAAETPAALRRFEPELYAFGEAEDDEAGQDFEDGHFSSLLDMGSALHRPSADRPAGEAEVPADSEPENPVAAEPVELFREGRETAAFSPTGEIAPGGQGNQQPRSPDPTEAGRALRSALATLQRMSGAA